MVLVKNALSRGRKWLEVACSMLVVLLALNGTGRAAHQRTPYLDYSAVIPATILCVNLDNGGENICYDDANPANSCEVHRNTDVSTRACWDDTSGTKIGCGYRLGYTSAGDWLNYIVDAQSMGSTIFNLSAVPAVIRRSLHMLLDRVNEFGSIAISNTSDWLNWSAVSLTSAIHALTLSFETPFINVNYIAVSSASPTPTPTATATPAPTETPSQPATRDPTPTVGAINDEFVGPFASWLNVRTNFGAGGNGISDDTTAIQNALNYLQSHGGVLYFPAGTYLISSTLTYNSTTAVRIIGHDPADTMIKWNGTFGSDMTQARVGFWLSEIGRITFNGNSRANAIITVCPVSGCGSGGSQTLLFDDVFENARVGWNDPLNAPMNSENTWLRDQFTNLGTGIYIDSWNGMNEWVWYSTFTNNGLGINVPKGNFASMYNTFLRSTTADTTGNSGFPNTWRGNVSSGSRQFYQASTDCNRNLAPTTFQGNRILDTNQAASIANGMAGGVIAIDNQIASASGNTTASITELQGCVPGNAAFLLGNQFTVKSPYISQGGKGPRLIEIGDSTVASGSISNVIPTYPTPPNLDRSITEETVGTNAAAIQAAINADCPSGYTGSNRPVIHLPSGNYNISATLSFPAYCDVQLIGDGMHGTNTVLTWTGEAGGKIIQLHSPSKVLISELELNGQGKAEGIYTGSEDVNGSRVQITDVYSETGNGQVIYASGLTDTLINVYGLSGYISNGASDYLVDVIGNGDSAARSRVACWTCDVSGASASPAPVVNVSNQGNAVFEAFYSEDNYGHAQLFDLTDSGKLSFLSGMVQPITSTENREFTVNGFNGTITLGNIELTSGAASTQLGNWSISNTTNTNLLLLGPMTDDLNAAAEVTFNSGVALRNGFLHTFGSGVSALSDLGTMSTSQMALQMAPIRGNAPSQDTALPTGTTDVRISRVKFDNLTRSFVIEPGP